MMTWLSQNLIGVLGTFVAGFTAYHVYFLSKKIDLREKLIHRDALRKQVEKILHKISQGVRRDVELVNSKKYEKHYPNNNDLDKDGYTYLRAELKTLRFDGIEFFCGMVREAYQHANGTLSFKKEFKNQQEKLKVFPVGIIPYEWIEYLDIGGDEFSYHPQFFSSFKGEDKSPYKYIIYYCKNSTYHKGSDPIDMEYSKIIISDAL